MATSKKYKIQDSTRCRINAIRERLQAIVDLDAEYGTLDCSARGSYQRMLEKAEDLSFAAMYQETDGKTIKDLSEFIKGHEHLTQGSVFSYA